MPRLKRPRPLTVWAAVFTAVVALAVWQNRMLGEQGREAHDTLCVFKLDLVQRATASQTLLDENTGPLIFGIPRTVIETSLANQKKTVDSLRTLEC